MSDFAEGLEVSPERTRAAAALRRLGHAFVAHDIDDELLDRVADAIDRILPDIESTADRLRPVAEMKKEMFDHAPAEGEAMSHFPDCIVSGQANPMGIAIRVTREGDDAVARVTLGPAHEGAPGRAHGGIVAAIFDDTLGYVLTMLRTPAFTGRLCVSYLAPTPLGVPIEFRGRLRERDGRKLWIDGEAWHDGDKIAEADGVFIAIPPERMGIFGGDG